MAYNFINSEKLKRANDQVGKSASEEDVLVAYLRLGGLVKDENGNKIPSYADEGGKEYVAKLVSEKIEAPEVEVPIEAPEEEIKTAKLKSKKSKK